MMSLCASKLLPNNVTLAMHLQKLKYLFLALFIWHCSPSEQYEVADNPLDGGRYFIENCMQGNFKKAKFYVVEDAENLAIFEKMASDYYGLDKEGRMQIRLASIQINEISAVDSTMTIMNYQNSFDKEVHKLKIMSTPKGWKVDLKYTYGPNL
jgi:predicted DNA binding CopG/RHH family protein